MEVEAREKTAESYVPSKPNQENPCSIQTTSCKVPAVTVAKVMCHLTVAM